MLKYDNLHMFGEFLTIIDRDTKVRKRAQVGSRETFLHIQAIVNHFIRHPNPMVVPVSKFTLIKGDLGRAWSVFEYTYDMKRLGMLDSDEKLIVNEASDIKFYKKSFDSPAWKYREKTNPKLAHFMKAVVQQNRYYDIHSGNILKDEDSYRIIDLEGFQYGRLDEPHNNWIKQ